MTAPPYAGASRIRCERSTAGPAALSALAWAPAGKAPDATRRSPDLTINGTGRGDRGGERALPVPLMVSDGGRGTPRSGRGGPAGLVEGAVALAQAPVGGTLDGTAYEL